ncbi:MAG: hypothetical protein K5880_23040 [Hydrogenophaga sp.]|uniref:hypothetical protein n=1 Tax=Hydrogenophaga sp. TaxID=1904254 RepID=UPI002638913F|nr:hypothetical protein [Hydrogenophaga sp.]MCV0441474.1 hypothetical protein [Hydrogenophaga sp.]
MDISFLELLSAGGNLSMMALVLIMWKFDRRLVVIETTLKHNSELANAVAAVASAPKTTNAS